MSSTSVSLRAGLLGDPGAPAVVLVHGIGSSSAYFRPLARRLADRWRVLGPDLAGHGRSPHPARPLTVDEHADALAGFLDAAGLDSPVLVGHSLGCQVVAALLAARPRAGRAVVLLGPTADDRARSAVRHGLRLARNSPREPLSLAPDLVEASAASVRTGSGTPA